ncbi:MAG: hypothetical protein AB1330_02495 [Bacillota bacterium]
MQRFRITRPDLALLGLRARAVLRNHRFWLISAGVFGYLVLCCFAFGVGVLLSIFLPSFWYTSKEHLRWWWQSLTAREVFSFTAALVFAGLIFWLFERLKHKRPEGALEAVSAAEADPAPATRVIHQREAEGSGQVNRGRIPPVHPGSSAYDCARLRFGIRRGKDDPEADGSGGNQEDGAACKDTTGG